MQPARASAPGATSRGSDSPVRAAVFTEDTPSTTVPSRGIFSPGRTWMMSPGATSSGSTVSVPPWRSTWALSGRMSIRSEMDRRDLSTAQLWNSSPTW